MLVIEARRNERIAAIETSWTRSQEEQRQQDDALIAFIRVARERREYEREQVKINQSVLFFILRTVQRWD